MDNISNLTSPNKVSQLLTANETPTNHVTVGKYIKYLCNALYFMILRDMTSEVRNTLKALKVLFVWQRYSICNTGKQKYRLWQSIWNVVCIELLRRGYDVYVGKLYQRKSTLLLREVAKDLYSGQRQHFRAGNIWERMLSSASDSRRLSEMIIARTKHPQYSYEGIEIHDIADWLLQE